MQYIPLILYATNVAIPGGEIGTYDTNVQLCQSLPEYSAHSCSSAFPLLWYTESDFSQIPPHSRVEYSDGSPLFAQLEDAFRLKNMLQHEVDIGDVWLGAHLNCENWTNPQSCGEGVVGNLNVGSLVLSACTIPRKFLCVCVRDPTSLTPTTTTLPSSSPTSSPSSSPTRSPQVLATAQPTTSPTNSPSSPPSNLPTVSPSVREAEFVRDLAFSNVGGSCVYTTYDRLICRGANYFGSLGVPGYPIEDERDITEYVVGPTDVEGGPFPNARLHMGYFNTTLIFSNGSLRAWGVDPSDSYTIGEPGDVVEQIVENAITMCARMASGQVWCKGENYGGVIGSVEELGHYVAYWTRIESLDEVTALGFMDETAIYAALRSGGVIAWGPVMGTTPTTATYIHEIRLGVRRLTCVYYVCTLIYDDDSLYLWGLGEGGNLGQDGVEHNELYHYPLKADIFGPVVDAVGSLMGQTCALSTSGVVSCTGRFLLSEDWDNAVRYYDPHILEIPGTVTSIRASAYNVCFMRGLLKPMCIGMQITTELSVEGTYISGAVEYDFTETGSPPPGFTPTSYPTQSPSRPTSSPTSYPTQSPSRPTSASTYNPTSAQPTTSPTATPTSAQPTTSPTTSPTNSPSRLRPTVSPTHNPSSTQPTTSPTANGGG